MFLEQQISILEWFLKHHVTQDWSNDAEKSALITGAHYIVIYIQKEIILLNKHILEHKRLI